MSGKNEKILLIIDQDDATRKLVRELSDKTGYFRFEEINDAVSSKALIEKVLSLDPTVIILDNDYEDLDTKAFLELVCGEDKLDCQLIILSECAQLENVDPSLVNGTGICLEKGKLRMNLPGVLNMIVQNERAKDSLIEKDEELKSIIETQWEMVCRFMPDTTLTFVNTAYARLFGEEPENIIGKKFLDFVPVKEHENIKKLLSGFDTHQPTATFRHSVELPDGSIGWQEWTDYAFFDRNGKITGFQSVGRDITSEVLLSKALEKSEEKERRLIARDLHDHIGQMLTYLKLRIENGIATNTESQQNILCHEILDLVIDCMQELRKVSRRVIAGFVKDEPLADTIKSLVESFEYIAKVKVKLEIVNIKENQYPEAKSNIYRIIQEAITNILKHAQATMVSIYLNTSNGFVNLSISDNGRGANVNSHIIKNGFITMRHRVNSMQGDIRFESEPGQFFKIIIRIPQQRVFQVNQ